MKAPALTTPLGILLGCLVSLSAGWECRGSSLGVYELRVETGWSREVFPKQYPEWRPPAQWSKVIGRSHNSSYHIFRVGDQATDGLKRFAEQGETVGLETNPQGGGRGVMDMFYAPPITEGVGVTQTQFFVDGNHSKVSIVARIVPSPDWFIGVDSFDLCADGQWLESVVLEVDPLDAGTDNGFTFTSPNWPSVPRKPITRITSQNPSHPANSFYYPDVDQHPPIATFYLAKVREYQLAQVFSPQAPSEMPNRFTSADLSRSGSGSRRRQYNIQSLAGERQTIVEEPEIMAERREEIAERRETVAERRETAAERRETAAERRETVGERQETAAERQVTNAERRGYVAEGRDSNREGLGSSSTTGEQENEISNHILPGRHGNSDVATAGEGDDDGPTTPKPNLVNTLVNRYKKYRKNRRGRKTGAGRKLGRRRAGRRRNRAPRNCRVTEWAEWEPCTKTCGIGEQMRTRAVLRPSRRGGRPCPPLKETKWCGSSRDCDHKYFDW